MRFQIPIGDWSDDGHGKCKYFTCESNGDIYDVRDAYWLLSELLGFQFHEICSDYGESQLTDDQAQALYDNGLIDADDLEYYTSGNGIEHEHFVDILVAGLNKVRPLLYITVLHNVRTPMLVGSDDRDRRHIGQLGYGLFY